MKRPRDPRPYLQDILDSIDRIRRYTEDLDSADFLNDDVVQDAVIRRIEIMGEAVGYLPDDLKERHPEVPWQDIKGMRNKLIHDYGRVDLDLVWAVARRDTMSLEPQIRRVLSAL